MKGKAPAEGTGIEGIMILLALTRYRGEERRGEDGRVEEKREERGGEERRGEE